jgi:hypothetical protein
MLKVGVVGGRRRSTNNVNRRLARRDEEVVDDGSEMHDLLTDLLKSERLTRYSTVTVVCAPGYRFFANLRLHNALRQIVCVPYPALETDRGYRIVGFRWP